MPLHLTVIGAGGLLGRGVVDAAAGLDRPVTITPVSGLPWGDPAPARREIDRIHRRVPDDDTLAVVWCAGIGRPSSPPAVLEAETELLGGVLADLESGRTGRAETIFGFASSGGAVWSGSPEVLFDESVPVEARHDYGHAKIRQEALLGHAAARWGLRVLIGRLSNLYGLPAPGRRLTGLVDNMAYNAVHRIPTNIYVPVDTQRDYVSAATAGRLLLRESLALCRAPEATVRVQVVAAGRSHTIGALADTLGRVLGRRIPMTSGSSPDAARQPRVLAFRSINFDLEADGSHLAHDLLHMVTRLATGSWRPDLARDDRA